MVCDVLCGMHIEYLCMHGVCICMSVMCGVYVCGFVTMDLLLWIPDVWM